MCASGGIAKCQILSTEFLTKVVDDILVNSSELSFFLAILLWDFIIDQFLSK